MYTDMVGTLEDMYCQQRVHVYYHYGTITLTVWLPDRESNFKMILSRIFSKKNHLHSILFSFSQISWNVFNLFFKFYNVNFVATNRK